MKTKKWYEKEPECPNCGNPAGFFCPDEDLIECFICKTYTSVDGWVERAAEGSEEDLNRLIKETS